ncbi:MAG: hypothetical protein V7752_19345 [Halopseudomonas sp.]
MSTLKLSKKGRELIKMYDQMAKQGYDRVDEQRVDVAFSDFELRAYRVQTRDVIKQYSISSVLDYGCGGSDWQALGFDPDSQLSAKDYFKLKQVYRYEPARDVDERRKVDCVVCFDVLEHVFVSDVPAVLRDIFSHATQLVVLNVACYPAAAKLPNGENAHITVRPAVWWKGMIDSIAAEYPDVSIYLLCSSGWRQSNAFPIWSGNMWQQHGSFVIDF